ncbi:hypothetical protein LTR86_001848 [Recurvomyces mirabilis]|nr:hypothetical protein LTR86_001848 [Recurvomyces mirabilis]
MAGAPLASGSAPASGSTPGSAPAPPAQLSSGSTSIPTRLSSGSTRASTAAPAPAQLASSSTPAAAPPSTLPPAPQTPIAASRATLTALRTAIAVQAALLRPDIADAYMDVETRRRDGRVRNWRTKIRTKNPGLSQTEVDRRAEIAVRAVGVVHEVLRLLGRVWFVEDGVEVVVCEGGVVVGTPERALRDLLGGVTGMVAVMPVEEGEDEDEDEDEDEGEGEGEGEVEMGDDEGEEEMEEQYEWKGIEDEGVEGGEGEDEEMQERVKSFGR